MTETSASAETPAPRSRKGLVIAFLSLLIGAAIGYAGVAFGLVPGDLLTEGPAEKSAEEVPDLAFVALDPIVVPLLNEDGARHLRFAATLEVPGAEAAEVAKLAPRVLDVLGTYLRAVTLEEIGEPAALIKLRAQMLRRVQIVVGENRVNDLLITEFIPN